MHKLPSGGASTQSVFLVLDFFCESSSDLAEEFRGNTKVRSNVVLRDAGRDHGIFFNEVEITVLRSGT